MNILVIGSKDHKRVHCIDWQAPLPNIEEYDSVVINMQSLTQNVFDKIANKIATEMKREIATLLDTEREVFCIVNQYLTLSPPTTGFKAVTRLPPTNYDWLPTIVSVNAEKPGTSITVMNNRFEEYLKRVDQWNLILDLYQEPPVQVAIQNTYAQLAELTGNVMKILRFQLLPIAENKSKKIIAGTLVYKGKGRQGGIHLLPPPTRCDTHEAIEILLDLIYGKPLVAHPPWREGIDVPGIQDKMKRMNERFQDIEEIQKNIALLQSEMEELDAFRDLLSGTGKDLVEVVQRALSEMGIHTQETQEGFPVDLINNNIAIEVTGIKGSINVGSEKVNQIARFREFHQKNEKIVLIANTYMDLRPSDRKGKMNFTPEVKEYLKAADVCLMTSETLFELWKDVTSKKLNANDVAKTILNWNGEIILKDFERARTVG